MSHPKPYILEKDLFKHVPDYLRTNQHVDLVSMTEYLVENIYRKKKVKDFKSSVKKVWDWVEEDRKNMAKKVKKIESHENGYTMGDVFEDTMSEGPKGTPTLKPIRDVKISTPARPKKNENSLEESLLKNHKAVPKRPAFSESSLRLCDMRVTLEPLRETVCVIVRLLNMPSAESVLFSGPCGSGKSSLIGAIAAHSQLPVFVLDCEAVMQDTGIATPLKKLDKELDKAHQALPCVLHVDKLDALLCRDGSSSSVKLGERREVTNVLTSNLAALLASQQKAGGSKFLLALESSSPDLLPAPLRNLCDHVAHIAPPSATQRAEMLREMLAVRSVKTEPELSEVATRTTSFVAQDLLQLCRNAYVQARRRAVVSSVGFEQSLASLLAPSGHEVISVDTDKLDELMVEITEQDLLESVRALKPALKSKDFPTIPDTTWDDIGGLTDVRKHLRYLILEPVINPEVVRGFGTRESSGILLWGPPGCGKTLIAKAVANEAGINLLIENGPSLLNMYQGESERAVRAVFARAASVAPCVIFFDEFDSLCPHRAKSGGESGSKSTIVNTLLTEMDGFLSRPGIYLLAATNLPAILDPAVLRPGRFDTKLYVGPPNAEGRLAVFNAATKHGTRPCLGRDVDLPALSRRSATHGFTGADCRHLVDTAALCARQELDLRLCTATEIAQKNSSVKRARVEDEQQSASKRQKDAAGVALPSTAPAPLELTPDVLEEFYPDGRMVVYARHIEQALAQVTPSVSAKDLKQYEDQKKIFGTR